MLVINVFWKCKEGKREEFLEKVKAEGIDAASRNEDGCFKYDFFASAEDPDDILLLEHWRDTDAHKAHTTQPHYKKLDGIKADYLVGADVRKYITEE